MTLLFLEPYSIEKDPEPFDVDIEVLTGTGTTLQIWEYRECQLIEYFPFLDENLAKFKVCR